MTAAFALHLFKSQRIRAGTAIVLQISALLRPSEIFSLTWNGVLMPRDLRLQPYGVETAGILVRNPKTALHIAQQQFVPVPCPATITLLMNLRSRTATSYPVFYNLSYASYRILFRDVLTHFELPLNKISLHGVGGRVAFHPHRNGQRADQLALIGRWRSAASVALYIENAKTNLAALNLGNNTHNKLRNAESSFFEYLDNRRRAVEHFSRIIRK